MKVFRIYKSELKHFKKWVKEYKSCSGKNAINKAFLHYYGRYFTDYKKIIIVSD